MNPKKKAQELIGKFMKIQYGMTSLYLTEKHAKRCAQIAVDEIINSLHDLDEIDMELVTYWQAVKTELEKM